jgi:hypothetical protein
MTRIVLIWFSSTLLCLVLFGCAHPPGVTTADQLAYENMRAETMRAIELEQQADVVVDYTWSDRILLWAPGQTNRISATDETLVTALASTTFKRELAVVIIGPPVRYAFPEPQLRTKVDSIEAVLKGQGFARVIFQLASAFGRPIYRE